ncbi:unnamed protein product [Urochloa humidicola]
MKQQKFLTHKLLAILMSSMVLLSVMLIGFLTGAESIGGRGRGQSPPAPVSGESHHQSSRSRDHGMQSLSPGKS